MLSNRANMDPNPVEGGYTYTAFSGGCKLVGRDGEDDSEMN